MQTWICYLINQTPRKSSNATLLLATQHEWWGAWAARVGHHSCCMRSWIYCLREWRHKNNRISGGECITRGAIVGRSVLQFPLIRANMSRAQAVQRRTAQSRVPRQRWQLSYCYVLVVQLQWLPVSALQDTPTVQNREQWPTLPDLLYELWSLFCNIPDLEEIAVSILTDVSISLNSDFNPPISNWKDVLDISQTIVVSAQEK